MKKITVNPNLELNFFEFGYLYASIKDNSWNNMPRTLWLKLKIAFTKAYLTHSKFGKQARKDLKRYEKELIKITRGQIYKKNNK